MHHSFLCPAHNALISSTKQQRARIWPPPFYAHLIPKRLLGELGQHKGGLVDLLAVVPEDLVLLLGGPGADGLLDVGGAVLGADHEADLAGRVGRDRGPAVLGHGEDLLALLLQAGDHGHVEPGVLGCED
jgi:hypothetical protein